MEPTHSGTDPGGTETAESDDWLAGASIEAASHPTSTGQLEVSFAGLDLPHPEGDSSGEALA
jgi:hypothetical protein